MPIEIKVRGQVLVVSGSIDEAASFGPIVQSDLRQIDWRAVKSINSFGVARLLETIHSISKRRLVFLECPPHLMDAFVMIPALLGPEDCLARIDSFVVSFDCEAGDRETGVLLQTHDRRVDDNNLIVPEQNCPGCKKTMSMNEEAHNYAELADRGVF
jgi:hypothetical protein